MKKIIPRMSVPATAAVPAAVPTAVPVAAPAAAVPAAVPARFATEPNTKRLKLDLKSGKSLPPDHPLERGLILGGEYYIIKKGKVYTPRGKWDELIPITPLFVEEERDEKTGETLSGTVWPYWPPMKGNRDPNAIISYSGIGVETGKPVNILNLEEEGHCYSDWLPIRLYKFRNEYFIHYESFPPLIPCDLEEDDEEYDILSDMTEEEIEEHHLAHIDKLFDK